MNTYGSGSRSAAIPGMVAIPDTSSIDGEPPPDPGAFVSYQPPDAPTPPLLPTGPNSIAGGEHIPGWVGNPGLPALPDNSAHGDHGGYAGYGYGAIGYNTGYGYGPYGDGYGPYGYGAPTGPSGPADAIQAQAKGNAAASDIRSLMGGAQGQVRQAESTLGSTVLGSQLSGMQQTIQGNQPKAPQTANITEIASSNSDSVFSEGTGQLKQALSEQGVDTVPGIDIETSSDIAAMNAELESEFGEMMSELQTIVAASPEEDGGALLREELTSGLNGARGMLGEADSSTTGSLLNGGGGNDVIVGSRSNDTLIGGSGDDIILGRGGNDAIYGGAGADAYLFGRGDGWDTIHGGDGPAGSQGSSSGYAADGMAPADQREDRLLLSSGVGKEDVWLVEDGHDLQLLVGKWSGHTLQVSDGVVMKNWFGSDGGTTAPPLSGGTFDGGMPSGHSGSGGTLPGSSPPVPGAPVGRFMTQQEELLADQVGQLLSFMASFEASGSGSITLNEQQHRSLNDLIAATWRPSSGI
jgi:hypothetical protein